MARITAFAFIYGRSATRIGAVVAKESGADGFAFQTNTKEASIIIYSVSIKYTMKILYRSQDKKTNKMYLL